MPGKNFSCNNASGKRRESDFYETPYSLTWLFAEAENPAGTILDPACGNGAIGKALAQRGVRVTKEYDKETDFLSAPLPKKPYSWIITNPPYSLAFEFIQTAKRHADNFAFLLPLSYLHGKKRYDELYCDDEYPLRHVYVFTRYPLLGEPLREDGKHHTGMMVYAWFVWTKGARGLTTLAHLDNDYYVLRGVD